MSYSQSESIKGIAPALAIAQQAITGAPKNSQNPHFRSTFADLASVRDAALPALDAAGLSLTQWPVGDGKRIGMVSQLTHNESGEWMRSEIYIEPDKRGPQPAGSVLTYLRRYSMSAVLGIPQVDDDGQSATESGAEIFERLRKGYQSVQDMGELEAAGNAVKHHSRSLSSEHIKALRAMHKECKETLSKEAA